MSVVTNILVHHDILEERDVKDALRSMNLGVGGTQVLRCLSGRDDERTVWVKPVGAEKGVEATVNAGDLWGGGKWPETDLWACACNYFDWDSIEKIAALPWRYPLSVQIFVQGQDDNSFRIYRVEEGKPVVIWEPPDAY
jgi:hypothetical protein